MPVTLKGKVVVEGKAEGEVLITKTPFSFLAGVNTKTGDFIFGRVYPDLVKKNLANKIFIYPFGKGSSGDCFRMWECAQHHVAPAAIINLKADPIHVQGAMMANIPMVVGVDESLFDIIKNGDYVRVEGNKIFCSVTAPRVCGH